MKKKIWYILLTMMILLFTTGCEEKQEEGEYQLYYLNIGGTKLDTVGYNSTKASVLELAEELVTKLAEEPEDSGLRRTIPSGVELLGVQFNGYAIILDWNAAYTAIPVTEEILIRAAVVKTLTQIPGVSYVRFTVEGSAFYDAHNLLVGSMNADSFVDNPGKQINSSIERDLTLYFSNEEGTALVKETRTVPCSSNVLLEKLIMEQLIGGPRTTGLLPTIPTGTMLITLNVAEGVCYVNLDETFRNQNEAISEQVVLYSIVNSLVENGTITKVQISVNGDSTGKVRYNYDLSSLYEKDMSMVLEN